MTTTTDTLGTIKSHARFDEKPRVADIPESLTAACESLTGIGDLFQSADRLITLAVARTLLDATAEDAIPEQVVMATMRAMSSAGLASGPAKRATRALGAALRVAKSSDSPMTGGDALREAAELTAEIFDHDTRRRIAQRKEREAAALKRRADAAAEAAEKAAGKAEGANAADPVPESPIDELFVGGRAVSLSHDEAETLHRVYELFSQFERLGHVVAAVEADARSRKAKALAADGLRTAA